MKLAKFNALPVVAAATIVNIWAPIQAWVDKIVAARPYATVDEAADFATSAAQNWTLHDLDTALADHPRIGATPDGGSPQATASRAEQAQMAAAGDDIAAAMNAANIEYEEVFGRIFLIRAAGRTPAEMLAEIRRRLANDPQTEAVEAIEQLRQIAVARLRTSLRDATDTEVNP